jgi:hypothetical protein
MQAKLGFYSSLPNFTFQQLTVNNSLPSQHKKRTVAFYKVKTIFLHDERNG